MSGGKRLFCIQLYVIVSELSEELSVKCFKSGWYYRVELIWNQSVYQKCTSLYTFCIVPVFLRGHCDFYILYTILHTFCIVIVLLEQTLVVKYILYGITVLP